MFDFIENENQFHIIMEYAPHGDLYEVLSKKGKFTENESRVYFR